MLTDGQVHDEANSSFPQFCERAKYLLYFVGLSLNCGHNAVECTAAEII